MKRALIIFSGGLDTTVCVELMREEGYEAISTVTIDVGQPEEDVRQATHRAEVLKTDHHVVDVKEEFARDYCFPAIHANADYFGYPLSTSIARPLIAQKAAEKGLELDADLFVHGCTGKGNDQFRLELGLRLFAPNIPISAPVRERNLTRTWEIEYAEKNNIPIGQSKEKIWSIDENIWGRSIEGGRLEDPSYAPPEEIFEWTKGFDECPDTPTEVKIDFEKGSPVAINGERLSPFDMIKRANEIAGGNGVGRIDMMEDRMIGLKVRENYECPGAVLLIEAHKALEALVMTGEERAFKKQVDQKWAELAYQGLWWDPFMESLNGFIGQVQERCDGWVKLRLYKGGMQVIGRESPWALYSEAAASFDDSSELEQGQMTGMVRTHGLATRLYAALKDKS